MFDLPSLDGVEEVVISEVVVNNNDARPLYIYSERKKEEALSTSA
jgi:ATP-dependent Clp protease ATP-binding subunit ClpX